MKILNLQDFLKAPEGTIFSHYEGGCCRDLMRKGHTIEDDAGNGIDYFYASLLPENQSGEDDDISIDKGESRWGEFDEDAQFAVLGETDLDELRAMLPKKTAPAPTAKEVRLIGVPGGKRIRCYSILWDDAPDSLSGELDVLVPQDVCEAAEAGDDAMEDYLSERLTEATGFCHLGFDFEDWHEYLDSPHWPDFETWYQQNYPGLPHPEEDGDLFRGFAAGRQTTSR